MILFSKKFHIALRTRPAEALKLLASGGHHILYKLVAFLLFWRVVGTEYYFNHCFTRASAIAYALMLSFIPILVTMSFMLFNTASVHPQQIQHMLEALLPFAPPTIMDYLMTFFKRAQQLRGVSVVVLLIVTVGLFGLIEQSFNTIWKVNRSRSFFARLRTFTMVIVYSPVLFWGSFKLRQVVWLEQLSHVFLPQLISFLLSVMAFTVFIWFVPNTKVRFRSAFAGGLIAGFLFELERAGFTSFIRMATEAQTIYGAFGTLLFFLTSLFVVALVMLFGAEIAYVLQNFKPLLRAACRNERRISDYKTYFSLRVMIDVVAAFAMRAVPPTLATIMERYEMTETQARGVLGTLVRAGFMRIISETEAYVPSRDFLSVPVVQILSAIEQEDHNIPVTADDFTARRIGTLLTEFRSQSLSSGTGITFAQVLTEINEGEHRCIRFTKTVRA